MQLHSALKARHPTPFWIYLMFCFASWISIFEMATTTDSTSSGSLTNSGRLEVSVYYCLTINYAPLTAASGSNPVFEAAITV